MNLREKINSSYEEETRDSALTAIKAHAISEREGEQAGLNYILNLMREAEEAEK